MKYDDLLPCQFCGATEEVVVKPYKKHGQPIQINGMKYWRVECLDCVAKTGNNFDGDAEIFGYNNGKEMAIAAWNRRIK